MLQHTPQPLLEPGATHFTQHCQRNHTEVDQFGIETRFRTG